MARWWDKIVNFWSVVASDLTDVLDYLLTCLESSVASCCSFLKLLFHNAEFRFLLISLVILAVTTLI
jgi:hypothetical protein